MRRRFQILIVSVAGAAALSSAVISDSFAQAAASPDTLQSEVVLVHLSSPGYPPLARATRISGGIQLLLGIRPDGSVESAVIVSGHPLLQQAVVESAQQSRFECRGCTEAVTSYSVLYTFQVADHCPAAKNGPSKDLLQDGKSRAQVIQSQNHLTVIDEPSWCDPGVVVQKVRSAKCLYLWKCGWHS